MSASQHCPALCVWAECTVLLYWVFLRTLYSSGKTSRDVIGPQCCISPGAVTVLGGNGVEHCCGPGIESHCNYEVSLGLGPAPQCMVLSPLSSLKPPISNVIDWDKTFQYYSAHSQGCVGDMNLITEKVKKHSAFSNDFLSCPLFKWDWSPLKGKWKT